ncbi:MAG: hypothetical protein KC416_13995 [Myxococcales bacterium]|nr:hypothetical protein [Myxococcales bacterium]
MAGAEGLGPEAGQAGPRLPARTELLSFVVATTALCGIVAAVMALVGGSFREGLGRAVLFTYGMPPAAIALLLVGRMDRFRALDRVGLRLSWNRWVAIAWLLPLATLAAAMAIAALVPSFALSLDAQAFWDFYRPTVTPDTAEAFEETLRQSASSGVHPVLRAVLQGMVGGPLRGLAMGLAQEIAWRGFVLSHVKGTHGWRTLVVGSAWFLWHVPLVLLGYGPAGSVEAVLPCVALWCLALSSIQIRLRERSGGVYAPALFLGTWFGFAPLLPNIARHPSEIWNGALGVLGVLSLAAVALGLELILGLSQRSKGLDRSSASRDGRAIEP